MRTNPSLPSVLTAVLCLAVASPLFGGPLTIFTGARLIDGSGRAPVESATLIIADGRIIAAGRVDAASYARPDAETISCAGQTIMPSLISDHSHIGLVKDGKVSPENYTPENIESALRQYEGYGVTAILALGGNKDLLYPLREQQRTGKFAGADIFTADHGLGVVNAAPPIAVGLDQIARPKTPKEARAMVRAMADRHPDMIKLWVDDFFGSVEPKMSPEIYRAIIAEAH